MMSHTKGRYVLQTFGCQMNMHDSERMEEVLHSDGWEPTDRIENADLVIFNTCSVREKAEQKLRSEVGKLAVIKEANPGLLIVVAGCVAQQEGEKLLRHVPLIDILIGPDNVAELPFLLQEQFSGAPQTARTVFDLDGPQFLQAHPQHGKAPVSALVTTMKGCDERCSFCVVPYTRGPERYRKSSQIIEEIKQWVSFGAKEVILLGQTVDSYKDSDLPPPISDHPDESQFPQLLHLIASEVKDLVRLRYISPHPRHATLSLAKAHAELPILARHVHLPVQSGSNRVLKRMIRRYTKEEYVTRAKQLQAARPGLTLSTDIIVGFPGETEEDFQATLDLVSDIGFSSVYAFTYSVRPHTPARKLVDDVHPDLKNERLQRLLLLTESIGQKHLAMMLHTTQSVLIEGKSKFEIPPEQKNEHEDLYQGRTDRNEIVHVKCPKKYNPIGQLVDVFIDKANKHSLMGPWTQQSQEKLSPQLFSFTIESTANPRRSLPILGHGSPR